MRETSFSPSRAVEAVLYLCGKLSAPTLHQLLKLRYFADKEHMSRYGYFASGDKYSALQFGPVGSATYDMLKTARGDAQRNAALYGPLVADAFRVQGMNVVPLRPANLSKLSKAELACLEYAISNYAGLEFAERTNVSHDSAWDAAWAKATQRNASSFPMSKEDIAATLANSEEVLEYISEH